MSGFTFSEDFPTTPGAYDTTYGGGLTDTFLTRIDPVPPPPSAYLRGDANGDLAVDIADGIAILDFLFGDGALGCLLAADVNVSAGVDLADPIALFTYAFASGPPPGPPFPDCGPAATGATLGCFAHPCN